ncbi:hypothetical protein [Paenibacillus aceris]|uniref:Uncharacterized protein n=1 Tax=Paenibacillus aceris TaxID=869555 RepID=A0ABS4HSF1_9BACL|nr:hypothetical protein [Paenibacillus aceris]MBP1961191.1 hypothetical protein [Paenibacillus aceris]NHW38017.1 hypothetical protein [Paenibacillus aceris]
MNEREPKKELIDLPFLLDDEDPLVDDVMSDQAAVGYFIEAMKRAGIEREKIAETLVRLTDVYSMPPYEATRIYYEFNEQNEEG